MAKTYHLACDIRGLLKNTPYPSGYRKLMTNDDGETLSPERAREELLDRLQRGEKLIPTCDCDGFDPQTGCPGHDEEVGK